jgi:hypothetical protein
LVARVEEEIVEFWSDDGTKEVIIVEGSSVTEAESDMLGVRVGLTEATESVLKGESSVTS